MKLDQNRLRELAVRPLSPPSPDELRRVQNVFFVGGNLPERQTLETLFESHYQCNAALFHLTCGATPEEFAKGEALARTIKKNFNAHLVGRLGFPAAPHLIERLYAAGVDFLDLPQRTLAEAEPEQRRLLLETARTVFPRWSVFSTLDAGLGSHAVRRAIDELLEQEVIPLPVLTGAAARLATAEASEIFTHLLAGWKAKKVALRPLLPLVFLATPIVQQSSTGVLRGFINAIDDRRLLATSDLRRLLRVKEVEQSYSSSGL